MPVVLLEIHFQPKLHDARSAAAEAGIPLRHIGSLGDLPLRTYLRISEFIISRRKTTCTWESEVWVIQNVEEFSPKLDSQMIKELCIFDEGEVNIGVAGSVDRITRQVAESPVSRLLKR